MDTAWLILLLPLAAASGWWLSARRMRSKGTEAYHQSCLLSMNQLLSTQDDTALDSFLEAISQQPKSVELQMVLGNLCRRKGEYERASLLHQSILNQTSYSIIVREQAQFELAQDYQAAGWLDRSESLYQELMSSTNHQKETAHNLLKLYQLQRDWGSAIRTANILRELGHGNDGLCELLVHFHCELCEQGIQDGIFPEAENQLAEAERLDPVNPRVLILNGRLSTFKGNPEKGVEVWHKLQWVAPQFVAVALVYIQDTYRLLNDEVALVAFLKRASKSSSDPKILSALLATFQRENAQSSRQFLLQYIKERPSLEGLKQILVNWKDLPTAVTREELVFLVDTMVDLVRSEGRFQCSECGFKADHFEWSCPSCHKWGAYESTSLSLHNSRARIIEDSKAEGLVNETENVAG